MTSLPCLLMTLAVEAWGLSTPYAGPSIILRLTTYYKRYRTRCFVNVTWIDKLIAVITDTESSH